MNEILQKAPEPKNGPEVWQEFNRFLQAVGHTGGGALPLSVEGELKLYEKFLGAFGSYLTQLRSVPHPSEETTQVLDALLYRPKDANPVFLAEVKDRLVKEVLNGDAEGRWDRRWSKEIDLVSTLVKKEYHRVLKDLGLEVGNRQDLESLAKQSAEDSETAKIKSAIGQRENIRKAIKVQAIELLSSGDPRFRRGVNEELAKDVNRIDKLVQVLAEISNANSFNPKDLSDRLQEYEELLQAPQGDSWVRQICLRAGLRQAVEVRRTLQNLLEERSELIISEAGSKRAVRPEFIWDYWSKKGVIPEELMDSFTEVETLIELADTARLVTDASPTTKARYLLPFLKKGVSAVLVSDVLKGKFVFDRNYIIQQIDALIPFIEDEKKSGKGLKHLKSKMAAALIIGTLLALSVMPIVDQDNGTLAPEGTSEEMAELLKLIPADQLKGFDINGTPFDISAEDLEGLEYVEVEPGGSASAGGASGNSQQAEGAGSGTGQGQQAEGDGSEARQGQRSEAPEEINPKNESPETLKNELDSVDWELDGEHVKGYYITKRAALWNPLTKRWVINQALSQTADSGAVLSYRIYLKKEFTLGQASMDLPKKFDYRPSSYAISLIRSDGWQQSLQSGKDYQTIRRADDSYYMRFSPDIIGQRVRVSYGFQELANPQIPPPSSVELKQMKAQLISPDKLPEEIKMLAAEMKKKNLSAGSQAKLWENYIKQNFWYSLSQEANTYYQGARSSSEFFQKVFELKKTDCDVTNSFLVAVLRSQGIYARMAFGYANVDGPLNPDNNTLTAGEGHGWVEAYINGQWITLDATPVRMDDETKAFFQKRGGGAGLRLDWDAFLRQRAPLDIGKWGDWLTAAGFALAAELAALGLLGLSSLLSKRNNARIDQLENSLDLAAQTYTGDKRLASELVDREKAALSDLWLRPMEDIRGVKDKLILGSMAVVGGPLTLWMAIKRAALLQEVPYQDVSNAQRENRPNAYEFYTQVLGYSERSTKLALYRRNYTEAIQHLNYRFRDLEREYSSCLGLERGYEWISRNVRKHLKKLKPTVAKDPETWREFRSQFITALSAKYSRDQAKEVARLKRWAEKNDEQVDLPKPLPAAEFRTFLEEVLALKLARWQIDASYLAVRSRLQEPDIAKRSLDKVKDKVSYKPHI